MDWVSFDEIKKTVSLEMVIHHYGIPLRVVGPNTLRGKCPLPTHSSKESKESFTATLTKGVGGAWACQSQSCISARGRVGGNVLDFVSAMEKCSVRDAAIKLQMLFLVPAAGNRSGPLGNNHHTKNVTGKEPERDLVSKKETHGTGESDSNKPLTFNLQNIDHAHPYLSERGVSVETAEKFGIGFFPGKGSMHGRIVIPIHDAKGELLGYAGRSIDGSEPRYKFPAGFHKSMVLYNLHRAIAEEIFERRIVVVEGFFDCLAVTAAGFPCVALMGSSMSETQEELIVRHFNGVCILLDDDEAGREGLMDCLMRLGRRIWAWAPALPEGKQPDILSVDELQVLLKK